MNTFFMNVSFSYVNDRALNEMHTFPMGKKHYGTSFRNRLPLLCRPLR
jgi:hypothetical protein